MTHVDTVANGGSLLLIIRWYPLEESLGVDFQSTAPSKDPYER